MENFVPKNCSFFFVQYRLRYLGYPNREFIFGRQGEAVNEC